MILINEEVHGKLKFKYIKNEVMEKKYDTLLIIWFFIMEWSFINAQSHFNFFLEKKVI